MVYDLIIVGGGPAGISAGIYAARKRVKTLLITKEWGGGFKFSSKIENFIGIKSISGIELAKKLEEHIKSYEGNFLQIKENCTVEKIEKKEEIFEVETSDKEKYSSYAILVASGCGKKKLKVPKASEFEGKGIFYCASCDAPLMENKNVAIIGGGNSGFETARQLLPYAKKLYILEYAKEFRAEQILREEVLKQKNVIPILMAEVLEVGGEKFVEFLKYKNRETGKIEEIKVDGIFVEIGIEPNSDFVKDLVNINDKKEIIVDHKNCRTSCEGIWAAGDVTDQSYKQIGVAIGEGIKAAEDIFYWLKEKIKKK